MSAGIGSDDMKPENLTEQEKRKIITKALDKNMFIEAGAGAGKTTIIVARILNLLMSGADPQSVVAITFTNAATRELRDRIIREAARIVSERPQDFSEEQLSNLNASFDRIELMQISTIHGFCHRILSERMFDAHLPYGFELAEEKEAALIRDRYFIRWAESLKRDDWEALLPTGKYRSGVTERIKNLAVQIDSVPADYEIKVALPDLSGEEALEKLAPVIDKISSDIITTVNNFYGRTYSSLSEVENDCLTSHGRSLRDILSVGELREKLKILSTFPDTKSFVIKTITGAEMEMLGITDKQDQESHKAAQMGADIRLRSYLESMQDSIKQIDIRYGNKLYRPYITYAKEAQKAWKKRFNTGLLTNDMLLERTLELVSEKPAIRAFLGQKFKYIYVDEFQDTDHVQEQFIRLIASDRDDPDKLRDGALFVVGDPKQSIYRFRGAEPEVYFETRERMSRLDNAYVLELSDNYRSNERLIDWVNTAFSSKDITPGRPYIPMSVRNPLPGTGLPDKLFAGVYMYEKPEASTYKGYIDKDVVSVCKLIKQLTGGGYKIADRDVNGNVIFRSIRYSDFLILSMNTTGMGLYEDAFHKYGIPVVTDSKKNISMDNAVNSFIRLYAYLTCPYDRGSITGAIETISDVVSDKRVKAEKLLEMIREDTREMSAYGCMEYLAARPELYMHGDGVIPSYRVTDIRQKIIQMTEKITRETDGNRGDILRAMYEYVNTIVEHELHLSADPDAVRFMNLHKAKGLEGNIVIWTNRIESRSFQAGAYRTGKEFYPSVGYRKDNWINTEWTAYGGDTALIDKAMREDESEKIRLEYVAVTRARQAFVFMDRYNKYPGNMFCDGYRLSALPSVKNIVSEYEEDDAQETDGNENTVIPESGGEFLARADSRGRELSVPVFKSESPSDYEDDKAYKVVNDIEKGSGRPVGNIIGNVMHRTFELVVSRWDCDPVKLGIDSSQLIPACIRQAMNENAEDIPENEREDYVRFMTDAVMAFGRWFKASDIKQNAVKIYTEMPFSYMITAEEKDSISGTPDKAPVWMHGNADLVAELNDRSYFVIDYKSDDDEAYPDEDSFIARLRGKYSPQITAYKSAVSRLFDVPEDKVNSELISFSYKDAGPGERIRLRVTEI